MSKRTFTPNSDNTAGQPRGDRQRQRVPGGRLVDGEFILDDAADGGGPSQPEVVSPHGDRAQCECVHLVTIQRWDQTAFDGVGAFYPRRQMMRCSTYVGDADFEFGWRHCTKCRPPWQMVARRARSIASMVNVGVADLGLDPPLEREHTRLRHLRILAGRTPPLCQCWCESCRYRVHEDQDTPRLRQQRFAEDIHAAQTDVDLITECHEDGSMALWAIPAVWVYVSRGQEYVNTITAVMHNIFFGVLDRLGAPVQDQEGPLMVD